MSEQPRQPDDYDLAIDRQVEEFLKLKQQLTYFLVTASVAVIVFAVGFAQNKALDDLLALLVATAITGVFAAGTALLSLHLEISSHRFHLEYRTKRVGNFDDVPKKVQKKWDGLNRWSKRFLLASIVSLALEVVLASWFMVLMLAD